MKLLNIVKKKVKNKPIETLNMMSLFSGIGAFEKALDNMRMPYKLVGFSEIDKYAVKSYCAIHGVDESLNLGDITKIDVNKLPTDIDLTVYGFPCQDISISGKTKGLFNEDGSLTRSGLFFEALRIIEATKPRVAIAENVKNLTGKKFKEQFEIVLNSLEQAGYNNYWKVLNAKDFGIPQNRERVFIVSIRKDIDDGKFEFPKGFSLELRLKDMLEDEVDEKFYISSTQLGNLVKNGNNNCNPSGKGMNGKVHSGDVAPTITTNKGEGPKITEPFIVASRGRNPQNPSDRTPGAPTEQRLEPNTQGICNTLTTVQKDNYVVEPKITVLGNYSPSGHDASRIVDTDGIAPTVKENHGTVTAIVEPKVLACEPAILKVDIPQTVVVRKYPVNCKSLCECLRKHKADCGLSNKAIAEKLELPITKVEHWFRQDDCFAIPEAELWLELKTLLGITTDEFDESIMTFEEKEGVYEKSERHYLADGIAPTLTSTTAAEKIIEPALRIRKLTPKECWRLMGFDDEDFEKAEAVNSNTQLYKQAGNSIAVPVLENIFTALYECGALK